MTRRVLTRKNIGIFRYEPAEAPKQFCPALDTDKWIAGAYLKSFAQFDDGDLR